MGVGRTNGLTEICCQKNTYPPSLFISSTSTHVLEMGSEIAGVNIMLLSAKLSSQTMAHSRKKDNSHWAVFFLLLAHTLVFLFVLHLLSPLVFHPVECSYCHSESMMGFRYRCQQCHNYQLCQDCFWRGHAGGSHSNQHQMKEYTSWVRQGPGNT